MAQHSPRLVRHGELAEAVWDSADLGESVLRGYIRDLRRALADAALEPRYIETIAGHGYRFVAEVRREPSIPAPGVESAPAAEARPGVVGRERELAALGQALEAALAGKRQFVFITGDTGIGKTTLLESFLDRCAETHSVMVARGQCVEQFGADEAYLPWLDALGRLGQGPHGRQVVETFERSAPAWLAQLPALAPSNRPAAPGSAVIGATQGRLLRELSEALEVLARKRPLIVALDDLQWADPSTIEFVSLLARRHDSARLMFVGTCRRAGLLAAHPLKRALGELTLRGEAKELRLSSIDERAIRTYLDTRFPSHTFPAELSTSLHRNTDGNPLFLVALIEDLVHEGLMREVQGRFRLECTVGHVQTRMPKSLRDLIDDVLDRLAPDEQGVLEAASILGPWFTAGLVGAALEVSPDASEAACERLARRGLVLRYDATDEPEDHGEQRYGAVHSLYRQVALTRIRSGRLKLLHARVGRHLEQANPGKLEELAPELSVHFERADDADRAARYHMIAAVRAVRCFARAEATRHFERALELLRTLPETPARDERELSALSGLGPLLAASRGYAGEEQEALDQRALSLARKGDHAEQAFTVLFAIWTRCFMQADHRRASEFARELELVAEAQNDPELTGRALLARAAPLLCSGSLLEADELLRRALTLCDPERGLPGCDPNNLGIVTNVQLAAVGCILGQLDSALGWARRALELARSRENPWGIINALMCAARTHCARREAAATVDFAGQVYRLAEQNDFAYWRGEADVYAGWAEVMLGKPAGLERLRRGLVERTKAARVATSAILAVLGSACVETGDIALGLSAVDDALRFAEENGELAFRTDALRVRAELLWKQARERPEQRDALIAEAERSALQAKELAGAMAAKLPELRATVLLARLWIASGRQREARSALAPVLDGFREGLALAELIEARELLDTPSQVRAYALTP